MINPYNPDLNKISYAYNHLIDKAEELDPTKKMSLLHPYKTSESVIDAIEIGGSTVDILSKMDPSLRKNPKEMLKIIERAPTAYAHIHKDIDTKEFALNAIRANHAVYSLMSQPRRDDPEICDAYRDEMLKGTRRLPIDATTMAMQFEHQFSKNANFDQIFSNQVYEQAFGTLVQEGPYLKDGTLRNEFTIVATTRMMRERDIERLNQIERNVWLENQDAVRKLAHNDRRLVVCDHALQAIEERCPELQPEIKREQKAYWQGRETEVLTLQELEESGQRLNSDQSRMLREALQHIELDERKRKETERLQKERNDNDLVYKRESALDDVRTAESVGEIARGDAADSIAHIEYSTPVEATVDAAKEHIAHAESIENNNDNIDVGRENYLERTATIYNPSMVPEVVVVDCRQADEQAKIAAQEVEEVVAEIELDEIVSEEYDEIIIELEDIEEEIEQKEIEDVEEEYVPWNRSYSDDQPRYHVYQ